MDFLYNYLSKQLNPDTVTHVKRFLPVQITDEDFERKPSNTFNYNFDENEETVEEYLQTIRNSIIDKNHGDLLEINNNGIHDNDDAYHYTYLVLKFKDGFNRTHVCVCHLSIEFDDYGTILPAFNSYKYKNNLPQTGHNFLRFFKVRDIVKSGSYPDRDFEKYAIKENYQKVINTIETYMENAEIFYENGLGSAYMFADYLCAYALFYNGPNKYIERIYRIANDEIVVDDKEREFLCDFTYG